MPYYGKNKKGPKPYWKDKSNLTKKVFRTEISDYVGNELFPGCIVAYSSGSVLRFGVYEGVVRTEWNGHYTYRLQLCKTTKKGNVRRSVIGKLEYNKQSQEYSIPKNVVVIKNPLYALANPEIKKCMGAIDKLKDEGHLPQDFKVK